MDKNNPQLRKNKETKISQTETSDSLVEPDAPKIA